MGGVGKTTLARQIFHHETVRRHFSGFALSLRPKNEEQRILEMTVSGLQDELFKLLETEKCLIVLDDMWSSAAWELIHWFLYLAHFPEDYEIQTDTLFNYWVAEGIVAVHNEETTIVDVAEDYLEELVKRSMVLVGKRNTVTSRIESCRLHDTVREVCLFKAKEENFIQFFNAQSLVTNATNAPSPAVSTNRSRRLARFTRQVVHIPNVLKKMKNLKYLMLPDELTNKTKLELSGLRKLETLKNFSLHHSSAKDLIDMTKLRTLWICCASVNPEEEVLPLSLGASLKQLEELMLYNKRNGQAQAVKIDAGAFVSGFVKLNQLGLDIKIYKLRNELQFPSWIRPQDKVRSLKLYLM
ncbi:PREDICTED: disease resistance protein RPH8A-like [Camelina sativa]|uniref:Disease resistance protein RPH8A-like n=1 Tax=Camelina sativa TaxID=90675 RepID=A0ABM1RS27_CAMSA|nr:PREDICTED: disease resistance protein RPH8A-like [Camelina sativa]